MWILSMSYCSPRPTRGQLRRCKLTQHEEVFYDSWCKFFSIVKSLPKMYKTTNRSVITYVWKSYLYMTGSIVIPSISSFSMFKSYEPCFVSQRLCVARFKRLQVKLHIFQCKNFWLASSIKILCRGSSNLFARCEDGGPDSSFTWLNVLLKHD